MANFWSQAAQLQRDCCRIGDPHPRLVGPMHLLTPIWSGQCTFLGGVPPASEKLPDVPTFLHVKEQLQGAQVPDMDPVDSTAHRLPTEVRVLPACCVIAAEEQARAPGSRPIPLLMGSDMGALGRARAGQGGAVVRASMLQEAVCRQSWKIWVGPRSLCECQHWGGSQSVA